jgi:catechol 2,3-dioxygenase-like lactoylglutathione lyase family enzyme
MAESVHHVHIFSSDIPATIAWWQEMLGAKVAADIDLSGTRNVFVKVGTGRLHIYDQPPKGQRGGAIHHIGIWSDDLPALVERLRAKGVTFRSDIREFGTWRYIMVAAPDDVLLELFSFDRDKLDGALAEYFSD